MRRASMGEAEEGIRIESKKINNLLYGDDTTLIAANMMDSGLKGGPAPLAVMWAPDSLTLGPVAKIIGPGTL